MMPSRLCSLIAPGILASSLVLSLLQLLRPPNCGDARWSSGGVPSSNDVLQAFSLTLVGGGYGYAGGDRRRRPRRRWRELSFTHLGKRARADISVCRAPPTSLSLSLSLSLSTHRTQGTRAMAAPKKTMRALQYEKYGGGAEGLKHVEVPVPSPKKGEVLLKLEAASINPIDWKIQKGMLRPFLPRKFPFIPVGDISGEVVELGSGVTNLKPGDKVVSISFATGGGLAEYAVAPASHTVARPPEVSAAEGASLPTAASTALQQLKAAGVHSFDGSGSGDANAPVKNVLVTAASGGVGHYAVQLAKLAGLHVTATCGARNLGFVGGLGADEVLDYRTPEGARMQSPSGARYDAVVHCATGTPWSAFAPVLADRATVVDVTPGVAAAARSLLQKVTLAKQRLVPLVLVPRKEEMEWLVEMTRQGKLKTVIDSRYPLSRAREAWAKSIEGHATGKIVVEMGGEE